MFESATNESSRRPTHHLRWFFSGGGVGLAIAIFLATGFGQKLVSEKASLTLWPFGLALMATDNASIGTAIFAVLVVYGSNFVFYGLGFLLISLTISFVRSLYQR
jgi:hypothetical protein